MSYHPDMDGQAVPEIGSTWGHTNGDTYTVTGYADMFSDNHQRRPPRVIYRSAKTGRVWSRELSDWYRAMNPCALAAPTAPAPTEPVAWRWKERDRFFDWTTDWSRHDKAIELGVEIEYAYATSPSAAASEATSSSDAEQFAKFFAMHAAELERNPYAYCELAYTRTTGWMAWITDKPLCGPVVSPDRKVLASGQGDTPAEAARAAINAAIATKGGKL